MESIQTHHQKKLLSLLAKMAPNSQSIFFTFISIFLVVMQCSLLIRSIKSESLSTGYNYLQHLEGCKKGQRVQGLDQVKQYLVKFGYLHYNYVKHLNENADSSNNTELFDESLESAIKTYQNYYHLKVTGSLDHDTIQMMMMPRCGNADVINGTSFPTFTRGHPKRSNKFFHTVLHYDFNPGMKKWQPSHMHLTYSFQSSAPSTVDLEVLRSVCSRALQRWASVTQFTFEEAQQGPGDIVIGFHNGDHGDGFPFDGQYSVLAHSFPPEDGRLHIDAAENWSTNPTSTNVIDLESVVTHELGHILGLAHSQDKSAIMYAYFTYGIEKRDLQSDDIQGIQALYS